MFQGRTYRQRSGKTGGGNASCDRVGQSVERKEDFAIESESSIVAQWLTRPESDEFDSDGDE